MNEKKGQKLAVLIVPSLMLGGLFPWNLFQCLYFLIFLSMIFVFTENSDICNLAENYLSNYLSYLLCGFCEQHSTQHVLFRLKQLSKELNNSQLKGTKPVDLSKTYDCFPHDLLTGKLEAYGLDKAN